LFCATMRCPKNTAKPPIAFYQFSFTMKARSVRNRPARMLAESWSDLDRCGALIH